MSSLGVGGDDAGLCRRPVALVRDGSGLCLSSVWLDDTGLCLNFVGSS